MKFGQESPVIYLTESKQNHCISQYADALANLRHQRSGVEFRYQMPSLTTEHNSGSTIAIPFSRLRPSLESDLNVYLSARGTGAAAHARGKAQQLLISLTADQSLLCRSFGQFARGDRELPGQLRVPSHFLFLSIMQVGAPRSTLL